jgi:hypothetical protein
MTTQQLTRRTLLGATAALGATDTILATDPDAVRLIRERTGGGREPAELLTPRRRVPCGVVERGMQQPQPA